MVFKQGDRIHYQDDEDARIVGFTQYTKPEVDGADWMMVVKTGDRIDNWLVGSITAGLRQHGREMRHVPEGDDR